MTKSERASADQPDRSSRLATLESHWFFKVKPTLVATIELSALIALIGTLLSIILNTILFRNWSVDFTTVATPTDILMSGINLSVTSILSGTIALSAFGIVLLAHMIVSTAPTIVTLALRILLTMLGISGAIWFGASIPWLLGASVGAGVAIAAIRISFLHAKIGSSPVSAVSICTAICALAALQVHDTLAKSQENLGVGIANRPDLCPDLIAAVWIGDKSIIGSCRWPEQSFLIIPRDSAVLVDEANWENVQQERTSDGAQEYPLMPADWYLVPNYSSTIAAAEYVNVASRHRLADGTTTIEEIRVYHKPTNDGIYYTRGDLNVRCAGLDLRWAGWTHYDRFGGIIQDPNNAVDQAKIDDWKIGSAAIAQACNNWRTGSEKIFGSILSDAPKRIARLGARDNRYWRPLPITTLKPPLKRQGANINGRPRPRS